MRALSRLRRLVRPARFRPPCPDIVELYDSAPIGAALLSPRGRFLKTNRALQEFLGYEDSELLEMDFDSTTLRQDLADCRGLLERVRRGELAHFDIEKRYVRKDGRIVWAHAVVTAAPGPDGRRAVALLMDITERKRDEERVKRSEEEFKSLYSRTPAMMHSIDRDDRVIAVSDRWLETLGYERDEVLGRRSVEFLTAASRSYAEREVLPEFFRTGSCTDIPYTFVRKDGGLVEVLLSATCERDAQGRPERSLAVLVDVTARKRAERELAKLRENLEERVRERTAELELRGALLAAMQETSIDGIMATDLRRRVIAYNKRMMEIWGAPPELGRSGDAEETVRHALALVADPKAFLRGVIHLYAHRSEKAFDEVPLRDGRTLERYSGPILGAGGRPIGRVWYYRDITERKRAERELEERTAELARSNSDLETYAYAASHDLSAPVRKISAYADLLQRSAGAKLDERETRMLEAVARSASRMSALIDDMLTLRRVGGLNQPLQPVDLDEVVGHALSDLELVISDAQASVAAAPLGRALGNANNLRRLFQNLISNAVKFRRPGEAPVVRVDAEDSDGWVKVSVTDNGIGFEQRFADKIFRPFLRLHPVGEYSGSGVGLAICRRIAQSCGGSVDAVGRPGEGSTFTVRLRRA